MNGPPTCCTNLARDGCIMTQLTAELGLADLVAWEWTAEAFRRLLAAAGLTLTQVVSTFTGRHQIRGDKARLVE